MWTWKHITGYPEDNYEESDLSTEEILTRLAEGNSFYYEYDEISLTNPYPSYSPSEFIENFGKSST